VSTSSSISTLIGSFVDAAVEHVEEAVESWTAELTDAGTNRTVEYTTYIPYTTVEYTTYIL
jgi:hypothetical protein